MKFYAHSNEKGQLQTLEEHLENVAKLSSDFSKKFGAQQLGYIVGVMHDIGKYSIEFQQRLLKNGKKVDHSTAGAIEVEKLLGKIFKILLGYIICGHHSGLMDYGSEESGLIYRFNKKIPSYIYRGPEIHVDKEKIRKEIQRERIGNGGFTVAFFIRMLYSSLVDADFLDTERFMNIEINKCRGKYEEFSNLIEKFNKYIDNLNATAKKSKINNYRKQIYVNCVNAACQSTNLFTLTVPTGGGKTLASMGFALNHLKYNNLKRIFCVIPYTSIIEQNAKQYKDIFGEENVLEHHSNFDFSKATEEIDEENYTTIEKMKLASENWDIPIVVTTNVQFFESLFSNKSSKCRKLHNLANSVIIIDEAQMLPTNFLKPSVAALIELVNNYNTSVVLATATKPEFPENIIMKKPIEIMKNPEELYEAFRRVEVEYVRQLDDEGLASKINNLDQVLVIVNTRNHAQKLYECLPKENLYHLSAKMCPVHRSKILSNIRNKLKKGEPCKVISSQLIECGVDISFPVVFRCLSGIDSIAQSAGRCNREGEMDKGKVYVFDSTEECGKAILYQSRTAECGRQVLKEFDDPLSLDAISRYFELLYDIEKDRLDAKGIMDNFEEGAKELAFYFEKAAKDYKLIEETESLIIPYDDKACEAIELMKYTDYPNSVIRKLQPYTISVHNTQLKRLINLGAVSIVSEKCYVLVSKDGFYDENTGLVLNNKEALII